MSVKYKVLFFNFPSMNQIRMRLEDSIANPERVDIIETSDPDAALGVLKANPKTLFVFCALNTAGYVKAKNILTQISESKESELFSFGIIAKEADDTFENLKRYGANYIFRLDAPIDMIAKHLNKRIEHFISKDDRPSASEQEEHNVHIKADPKEEGPEQKVLSYMSPEDLNLESGKMSLSTNDTNLNLKLEHFDEESLDLEVLTSENYAYNSGDKIDLNIVFEYNRCRIELFLEGVIETIELNNSETSTLCIKLSHNEQENLERFMTLYSQRQKSIDDFMMLARGVS